MIAITVEIDNEDKSNIEKAIKNKSLPILVRLLEMYEHSEVFFQENIPDGSTDGYEYVAKDVKIEATKDELKQLQKSNSFGMKAFARKVFCEELDIELEEGVCSDCYSQMEWCDGCNMYSQTCCDTYGTCQCS